MNDVLEALSLAQEFEKVRLYRRAMCCYNLAIHFLTLLKRKRLDVAAIMMCDEKILYCVRERNRIRKLNNTIILKKYVLLQ